MSIESELAKRDRLLSEKSARIRELEHMVETRGESIRNLTELLDKCHARIRELEAQSEEQTCKQERLFNLIRRECDGEWYEWHGEEMPNCCPNCGRKVKR